MSDVQENDTSRYQDYLENNHMRKMKSFAQEKLTTTPPEGSNLKVGDTVYWTNDFGVEFENKIIGFNYTDEFCINRQWYAFLDTSSYWFPRDHKTLSLEKPPSMDTTLILNNGATAIPDGVSDFGDLFYSIHYNEKTCRAALLEGVLYSLSDYEEPISPLKNDFQISPESFDKLPRAGRPMRP